MMQMPFYGGSYPGMPSPLQGLATPSAQQQWTIGVPGGRLPQPGPPMPPPQAAPQPPQPQYGWGNPEQPWWTAPQQGDSAAPSPPPERPFMPMVPEPPAAGKGAMPPSRSVRSPQNPYGPDYYRRHSPNSLPPQQAPSQGWRYQDPQAADAAARAAGGDGRAAYNAAVKNNWQSPETKKWLAGMTPANRRAWQAMSGL